MTKTLILAFALSGTIAMAQSDGMSERVAEGTRMYKTEMASWYGTDIFMARFAGKRQFIRGYLSYLKDDKAVCMFYSNSDVPKVIASFTFDSTYNINTALVDSVEREVTPSEADLISIREAAITEFKTDRNLFKIYPDTNPNFIPLIDENGKRVYVLTGPRKHGVVLFGNDYLLTFSNDSKLKEKKELHKSLIAIEYGNKDGKNIIGSMHTHVQGMDELITATDVCTLLLYCKYTGWESHTVVSSSMVSLWNCGKGGVALTKDAWEKINDNQKKKKKKK